MYNAQIRHITFILTFGLIFGLLACSRTSPKEQTASTLLENAQNLYSQKQFPSASLLLDSIEHSYQEFADIQRKAMYLRTLVIQGQTIVDSIANEDTIKILAPKVDSLATLFKYVKTKEMVEGYYVLKSISANALVKRSGIEARIDEQGNIYLISSLYGQNIQHTHIAAISNGKRIETIVVPFDNAQNYRYKDNGNPVEMITFHKDECDSLCQYIAQNRLNKVQIEFCGKRNYTITLTNSQKKELAATYDYATLKKAYKTAVDKRIFFEKKLQIARKQELQTKAMLPEEK